MRGSILRGVVIVRIGHVPHVSADCCCRGVRRCSIPVSGTIVVIITMRGIIVALRGIAWGLRVVIGGQLRRRRCCRGAG